MATIGATTGAEAPSVLMAQRLALAVPALMIAAAYVAEYAFGLYPCEMCWWQRYAHFAALLLALAALFLPRARAALLALSALAITAGAIIAGFHAGVEYGWWEGFTSCSSTVDFAAGGNALDAVMNAPLVRCDQAPWSLAGISLAGWNALISMLTGLALFRLLGLRERP